MTKDTPGDSTLPITNLLTYDWEEFAKKKNTSSMCVEMMKMQAVLLSEMCDMKVGFEFTGGV